MAAVQLPGIRVVVFDLDDTLYPERAFAFSGFEAVAALLRKRLVCAIDPVARMRELFDSDDRGRVFDRILAELGCDQPGMVREMIDCYRAHRPTIALYPDAEWALGQWAGRLRLGLISDGYLGVQQRKVEALGLSGRLDPIILTDRWGPGFWKPHPRAFEEIERICDATGPSCVYVADNPQKDFIAPRELIWRTIRIRRDRGVYRDISPPAGGEPEFEVTSLKEIDLSS